EPNETILLVPKPVYGSVTEGRNEWLNDQLINLVGADNLYSIHSINPSTMAVQLEAMLSSDSKWSPEKWNIFVAPLGTKPQAIGLYLCWRKHPYQFSILPAKPYKTHELFSSSGIGRSWEIFSGASQ